MTLKPHCVAAQTWTSELTSEEFHIALFLIISSASSTAAGFYLDFIGGFSAVDKK